MCFIHIKDGIAEATNGFILARLNLAEYSKLNEVYIQKLNDCYIHRDAWKLLHDADDIEVNDEQVLIYHKGGAKAEISLRNPNVEFPNTKELIEKIANSTFGKRSFLSINPKWIAIAQKMFNVESMIVRFYEGHEMLVVFPAEGAKGFIGIAPFRIDEQDAVLDFTLS